MNKEIIQFSNVEELIKSLEKYSGITFAPEDVDTREKLLNKISQIQESLSNEVSYMCSHYHHETERLIQINCTLPKLTPKEENLEDKLSSYLKMKWRQVKSYTVTTVIIIIVLVFLMILGKVRQEGINAQIDLYEKTGIWLGR